MTEQTRSAPNPLGRIAPSTVDLLPALVEAVPVPVVLLTADARVRYANAAFVQTLEIAKEHYLHKKFPRHWLMHPHEAFPQLREMLYRAGQAALSPEPVQLSLRSSDRSEIPTEVHVRALPNLSQGPDGLMIVTFKSIERSAMASLVE